MKPLLTHIRPGLDGCEVDVGKGGGHGNFKHGW
mgnify:CR=1 FL=1